MAQGPRVALFGELSEEADPPIRDGILVRYQYGVCAVLLAV